MEIGDKWMSSEKDISSSYREPKVYRGSMTFTSIGKKTLLWAKSDARESFELTID